MPTKTEATSLKMTPEVRYLWDRCAEAESRTLSNMVEVMVRTCAKKLGVAASTPPSCTQGAKRQPGGTE